MSRNIGLLCALAMACSRPGTLSGNGNVDGLAGESLSITALVAGDPNCPMGGTRFDTATATSFACNGTPGAKGDPGSNGSEQGPQGPTGAEGPAGAVGAVGPQGPMGPAGSPGPQGFTGPAGVAGARGLTGPAGATGAQGPVGPAGSPGAQGLTGLQGPTGPQGADNILGRSARAWQSPTSIQNGVWTQLEGSVFQQKTRGGALLIFMDVTMVANGSANAGCRPMIDGLWAGRYGGIPFAPDLEEGATTFLTAGLWELWAKTRLYAGIPAGTHDFRIECRAIGPPVSSTVPIPPVTACFGQATCAWGFVELT